MCKSLCDSLVCKYLFALKNLPSKTNLDLNHCLLINDSLSRIAIIHKKLLVANQKSFTLLDVAG